MKNIIYLFTLLSSINVLSQSGEIDTTFGINGKVTTGFGAGYSNANAVAVQLDGKIIVGGTCQTSEGSNHFALARYNTDGTLDDTFGVNGKIVPRVFEVPYQLVYNVVSSIVLLDNGKFLVAGAYGIDYNPSGTVIARFNNDGTIDYTFGTDGKVYSEGVIPFKDNLKIQPDGKFIVGSKKYLGANGINYEGFEFDRYSQHGVLDTAFGTDGKVITSFGNVSSKISSFALLPDGKFIASGAYSPINQSSSIAIVKYNNDGSLDTSFDTDGKVITTFGTGSSCYGVYITSNLNGKIIVAATVITSNTTVLNFGLIQYNPNGSLDTTFDGDGKALSIIDDGFYGIKSVTKDENGKYLVNFTDGNLNFYSVIRKYNTDISLDSTFGTNGKIQASFDLGLNGAQNATITTDSKIVIVGNFVSNDYTSNNFGIAKYNSNGTLDTTFDTDGKLTTKFEYSSDELKKIIVLPDNKIIAIGTSRYRQPNNAGFSNIVLSKYNSNGSLDVSFGNSGKVYSVFGENVYTILNFVVQTDGKILVNAYYSVFPSSQFVFELIRYNANGSLDVTFGNNGKIVTTPILLSLVNPTNGKFLFNGINNLPSGENEYTLIKYNANGTIDNSFGSNGTVAYNVGNSPFGYSSVVLQPDGKIIASGSYSNLSGQLNYLTIRYNSNGTIDSTFGTNGTIITPTQGNVNSNFVQSDEKIIVCGSSSNGSGINFSSIKYDSNGTIDSSYGINGIASISLDQYYQINSVYLQPDNKILVALSQYNPQQNANEFKVKRINADGSIDTDFGVDNGITTSFYNGYNEAFSIGLQSDNKIIVAGTTNNSINNDFAITRLTNSLLSVDNFNENSLNLILYPNPVTNILNIKTLNELVINEYSIYNMLGQMIYKSADKNLKINTTNFTNGIYSIKMKTSSGFINKKFIKE